MDDDLGKLLSERLAAPRPTALEGARSFLLYYVHDSDPVLLERDVRSMIKVNARPIIEAVVAIEEVVAQQPAPGTLSAMVAYEGNQMLQDDSDETASRWLTELAQQLRELLGEHAPPVPGGAR